MKKRFAHITGFFLLAYLCALPGPAAARLSHNKPVLAAARLSHNKPGRPKRLNARQLMIVITPDWSALQGSIFCYTRQHGKWILQFTNPVVVGSKGLGLGDGFINLNIKGAPVKKEGDLKSPAGFFTIGAAFGYAGRDSAGWIKNHYIKATDTLICVDDMRSAHYNTLINNDTAKSDYKSWENMRRKDNYYKWGLFINHNAANPVPGAGSCIFMHIWQNDHEGTAGCTAMTENNLLRILHWLNAPDHPLLAQMPKAVYDKVRKHYGLPRMD